MIMFASFVNSLALVLVALELAWMSLMSALHSFVLSCTAVMSASYCFVLSCTTIRVGVDILMMLGFGEHREG